MDLKLYKEFIEQLVCDGIRVQDLTVKQISKSIKLYKIIMHR